MKLFYLLFLLLPIGLFAQSNVGINTDMPEYDLDVRGTDDNTDGGELQLSTPAMTNFLRFFSGRLGDPNPFMAFHDDDTFHIVTTLPDWSTYARRVTLLPNGNFGIGTDLPTSRLHLFSNSTIPYPQLRLTESGSDYARIKMENTEHPDAYWDIAGLADTVTDNAKLNFFFHNALNAGDRMTITGRGNVGIGTTTPASKLDIRAVGDGAQLLRFNTDRPWIFRQTDVGVNTKLTLQPTISDKAFQILSQDSTNRAAVFFSSNVHSNVLLVPDGGEAGVGVEDPLAKFHIRHNSSGGWPSLRITEIDADYARIKLESEAQPSVYWDIAGRADSSLTASKLNFFYSGPNGIGDRMTITGEGNVGINKTSPEAELDIRGGDWNLGGGAPGDFRIGTNSTNAFRIGVATGGGGAGTARMYSEGGALILGTNSASHLTIDTDGDVGIGTTNPGNKLRVHGNPTSTAHVLSVSSNYSGSFDVRAVEGFSTPAAGYGFGGYFEGGYRGVRATGQGTSYTGTVIGLEASAYGTAGTRTGLFARASGGTTNWAGYFAEGNVYVTNELRIGSGASSGASGYKVAVDGKIIAEGVRVQLSQDWPDYVFSDTYECMSLEHLEASIRENKHLPGVPSAAQVKAEGIDLGEMQTILMEKIEELTLHMIEMNERVKALEQENGDLKQQLKSIHD
jgi:hypothetical protein